MEAELLAHWEGEPIAVWEGLWGIPRLEAWRSIGSTNDRARELARAGAASFTVVVAEEQTAGRGRGGRSWSSPAGRGLWMSFLAPGRSGPLTPLLAGLGLARAIEAVTEVRAGLKWPNDLWVDGRKVAGILCEAAAGATVVGMGVNVRQERADFPPELAERASSLELAQGGAVSRSALTGTILRTARRLLDPPTLRLDDALADELARRDVLAGRALRVDGVSGVGRGVDRSGRLRIETPDGSVRTVTAGHVELDETPASP